MGFSISIRKGSIDPRTGGRLLPLIAGVLGGLSFGSATHAQSPYPVDFTGVWSTNSLDVLLNEAWDIEGLFSCRCTSETYDYLRAILDDPSMDHMSAQDIVATLEEHTLDVIDEHLSDTGREVGNSFDLADDPSIQCEPFGVFRTILHSDPIEFVMHEDRIEILGEDLTVPRTVYMDGRGHPEGGEHSTAGHSIGWFEGDTLVVETVAVASGMVDDQLAIHNSDQARSIERYTISADGRHLDATFTLYDPVMLVAPLTIERPRVLTPEVELDIAPCEVISGEF